MLKTKSNKIFAMILAISMIFSMLFAVSAAPAGTGTYIVEAQSGLIVRSGPGTSYSRVGGMSNNTTFTVTKVSGSWGYIPAYNGWSCLDYARLISNGGSSSTANSKATTAINKAKSLLGSTSYNGYCQKFVRICFESAGIYSSNGAASARDAWNKWGVSTSSSNIPVGAAVYFTTSSQYGHVGIYIGNGEVIHAVSTVKIESLSSMMSKYGYLGWGWQAGTALN